MENQSQVNQIRDDVGWGYQTMDQLQKMRMAWNLGDVTMIKTTTESLFEWLRPYMPPSRSKEIDALKYGEKALSDFYTEPDRKQLRDFGALPRKRRRDLDMLLAASNKTLFKEKYINMYRLIMAVIRDMNLGAEIEEEARISHDKKKPITMGRRFYRASTRTFSPRKGIA